MQLGTLSVTDPDIVSQPGGKSISIMCIDKGISVVLWLFPWSGWGCW